MATIKVTRGTISRRRTCPHFIVATIHWNENTKHVRAVQTSCVPVREILNQFCYRALQTIIIGRIKRDLRK